MHPRCPQELGKQFLCTLEAIYYFLLEHFEATHGADTPYDGRYDDLLLFFTTQLARIRLETGGGGRAAADVSSADQADKAGDNAGGLLRCSPDVMLTMPGF